MKQQTLTVEQFRALAEAQRAGAGKGKSKSKSKSKYHARKCHGYASEKEYGRAQELKLMAKAGIISDLREQVSFVLIPAQYGTCGTDPKGRPVRICLEKSCRYIADFVYTDNATGSTVIEDTKGFRTPEYKIKRKLMLWVHGITIKEI